MTPPRYWHLSIRFFFFQLCLPPRFPSPPGVPTDINVYGGDPDKEIEGATTCNFGAHIVGLGFAQDRYFGSGHVSVVCMYV